MASLLNAVRADARARRAEAAETYRELLARADDPRPGDQQALEEAMGVLGLSPDDVAADLRALAQAESLRRQIVPQERLDEMARQTSEAFEAAERELRTNLLQRVERMGWDALARLYQHMPYGTTDLPDQLRQPAFLARMSHGNAVQQNEELQDRLARLAVEHPNAFDLSTMPAPKPKREPPPPRPPVAAVRRGPLVHTVAPPEAPKPATASRFASPFNTSRPQPINAPGPRRVM
jgi:hypothetical protein